MLQTITSIDQLIRLARRPEGVECSILLNYGMKSSKIIRYYEDEPKPFSIWNLIDDTTIHLKKSQLFNNKLTLVGEAISKGALIAEN